MMRPLLSLCFLMIASLAPSSDARAQNAKLPPEIQKRLDDYNRARKAFLTESDAYWSAIAEKRKLRAQKRRSGEQVTREDYVLTQPPVYAGPERPQHPSISERDETIPPRAPIPVIAPGIEYVWGRQLGEHTINP